jgi:hypothetical protein
MRIYANPTPMTDERRFEELLAEFERIGVDLNSFPAGLTVSREEALNILRSLPADAGPGAFLARVRELMQSRSAPSEPERASAELRE